MSDYMTDLISVYGAAGTGKTDAANSPPVTKKDRSTLDLNDYLQLMVAMFQNQTIDNTADISDMMNNMVQMSVVEAISSISSLIQESTALNYAASLVGKQVTVGIVNNGQLIEIEGYVAATGTYNGQQVIFLKDKSGNPIEGYFPISSVMAIGWLSGFEDHGEVEGPGEIEDPEGPGDIEDPENPGEGEDPEDPGEIEDPDNAGGTESSGGADGFGGPMDAGGAGGVDGVDGAGGAGAVDEVNGAGGADGFGEPMDAGGTGEP